MKVRMWQMNGDSDDPEPFPWRDAHHQRSGLVLDLPPGADFTPFNVLDLFCRSFDDEGSNYKILWSHLMMHGEWLVIASDYDPHKVPDSGPWEWLLIAIKEDE